jgi:Fe-S-cluster containining protein
MDMLPVPHSDELHSSTNGGSGLKPLERQVERGQLFAHTALGESFTRLGETEVFLHGLLDLLLAKGIINEDELSATMLNVRQELVDRGELAGPGIAVRIEEPEDTPRPPVEVDCKARMHICHAVCCKLDFALSIAEVEVGKIKWDLGRPYFIRHEEDGYCTHIESEAGGCKIYCDRPAICRWYSCAGDERIWKNFEKMELNEEWIEAHLSPTTSPRLTGTLMNGSENASKLIQLTPRSKIDRSGVR